MIPPSVTFVLSRIILHHLRPRVKKEQQKKNLNYWVKANCKPDTYILWMMKRDSDDDVTEQIGPCNLPGRSRSNRIITAPARFYDYFCLILGA